jgi:hypothetical protein
VIASAHVAAGAVAGLIAYRLGARPAPSLAMAFVIGVGSHVVLDAIPHGDYAPLSSPFRLWVALVETLVTLAVVALIVPRPRSPNVLLPIAAGIAGSILPDAKSIVSLFVPRRVTDLVAEFGDRFHGLFHAPAPDSPIVGWSVEIAATVVLLITLVALTRVGRARLPHAVEDPS